MKNFVIFLLVLIFIGGCFNNSKMPISQTEWLIGTWEMNTSYGSVYEDWRKISKNEFLMKSFALENKDTVILETVKIVQEKDSLFYIPTVKNQNSGKPIRFSLKTISENHFDFENVKHDFPQMISYSLIQPDSLMATISGIENGKTRKEYFPMKRLK